MELIVDSSPPFLPPFFLFFSFSLGRDELEVRLEERQELRFLLFLLLLLLLSLPRAGVRCSELHATFLFPFPPLFLHLGQR